MWKREDLLLPWTWFCFFLWVGLTLATYLRILWPAEWFQQAGVGRLSVMLLNLWATELVVAILWVGVSMFLVSFEDDGPTEEAKKRNGECPASG